MRYFIVKECFDEVELPNIHEEKELPNERIANAIMKDNHFIDYILEHDYHFTNKLAEHACSKMENNNGLKHTWTCAQVKATLDSLGLTDYGDCTLGDVTYLANMAYADFYPEIITSEIDCLKYAIAIAHDKDGYDGIVLSRWIADLVGKCVMDIEWAKFI